MVDFQDSSAGEGFESGILRLYGRGDEPVDEIVGLLNAINAAYEGLVRYEFLVTRLYIYWRHYSSRYDAFDRVHPELYYSYPANDLPPGFRLSLKGVRLQSPGFWDFFGKLNPLEVLRNAINDAHERRKDRAYRESAEAKRLHLENIILENEALSGRIAVLRDLGMTEEEMAQIRTTLIHQPIERVLQFQNSRLIDSADLTPSRRTEPPSTSG
ncbi:hypothetical protein MRS76_21525 [Rhizobiaceae bacterium n13]|uniref:Uncharacterized protein n=1 Tax=Ferirhizobium litorale TaxID=2927786 RepID=A0AAE3U399_9HYPH|nr:hypothetical protein [Fererhizobium litorale]MDI7864520.1 hypothetical protein [Fererhizobium litorale]MDI7924939.1 hypothetical protein [Fererhizobium litorale]